jgi:hypothetical protein
VARGDTLRANHKVSIKKGKCLKMALESSPKDIEKIS